MVGGGFLGGVAGGATVLITIRAADKFSSIFRNAEGKLSALRLGALAGATAVIGFGVALAKVGVSSLKVAADFEQTQVAFTTMLGSAEAAQELLKELADFGKRTPFTLTDVEKNAKLLLAMGIEVDKLLPTLKSLGDVSAGLSVPLERIALNFGQVKTQGKLTGRELRDFNIAGVPLIQEIAKNLGLTEQAIKEMVSAGEIGFDIVEEAFRTMSSEGGKFEDLMTKQAETVSGKFSNLQDTFELMQREIGAALIPIVAELADVFLNDILPAIEPLIPLIGELLSNALKGFADVIVPMIPSIIEWAKALLELGNVVLPILVNVLKVVGPSLKFILAIITSLVSAVAEFIDFIRTALNLLSKLPGGGKLASGGGGFGGQGFQHGGLVQQTGLAMVHKGERVISRSRLAGRDGGGMTIIIENLVGLSAEDISRSLREELFNKLSL